MHVMITDWSALLLGGIVTGLLLAIEHWFPYTRPLSLIHRYIAGVFALWVGFALWRVLCNDWVTPLGLMAICGVGGATVIGGYWLDEHQRRMQQALTVEHNDEELQG